jgi:hypothetical protein
MKEQVKGAGAFSFIDNPRDRTVWAYRKAWNSRPAPQPLHVCVSKRWKRPLRVSMTTAMSSLLLKLITNADHR